MYSEKPVTVRQLIEALSKCPQDMEIQLYYDGAPRLVPNFAFQGTDEYGGTKRPIVVLGEKSDVYNLEPSAAVFFNLET